MSYNSAANEAFIKISTAARGVSTGIVEEMFVKDDSKTKQELYREDVSPLHGAGYFATQDIPRGTLIFLDKTILQYGIKDSKEPVPLKALSPIFAICPTMIWSCCTLCRRPCRPTSLSSVRHASNERSGMLIKKS